MTVKEYKKLTKGDDAMPFYPVGTLVTTKAEIQADYSGYQPAYPVQTFKPEMIGIVVSGKCPSVWRDGVYFQNITFLGDDGKEWRVGLTRDLMKKLRYTQVPPELLEAAKAVSGVYSPRWHKALNDFMQVLRDEKGKL